MEFSCPLEDDYIFELTHFAFIQKISYEHDSFSRAEIYCEEINSENEEGGPDNEEEEMVE